MLHFFRPVVLASLCTLSLGCTQAPNELSPPSPSLGSNAAAPATEDATRSIMAILKAHEENWNRHDMDAWAEMLHEDADWVHWRGGYWRGKAEIKAGHEQIHRTFYKSTHITPQRVEDLTFLTPEVAVVHARSELTGDERAPGETFRYRKTILFTKQDGVWRIRALHNTRLQGVD